MSRTISANEQYFFLTTNQRTVLLTMAFQQSEQDQYVNVVAGTKPFSHFVNTQFAETSLSFVCSKPNQCNQIYVLKPPTFS